MAQDAYFDMRVFHPNAQSNNSGSISALNNKHESIMKRANGQRVQDVEHGVFTSFVFFHTRGRLGKEATTFYKRLADMFSWILKKPYFIFTRWLRCKLSFDGHQCIRGTRSSNNRPLRETDINLATSTRLTCLYYLVCLCVCFIKNFKRKKREKTHTGMRSQLPH